MTARRRGGRRQHQAGPGRGALLEERGIPSWASSVRRVSRHDLARRPRRRRPREPDLLVERALPERQHASGSPPRCAWRARRRWRRAPSAGTASLISPHSTGPSAASIRSPVSSICMRPLAADRSRQRHHRRGAEQPDAHARRGEARAVLGDGEVAGRDELAARPPSPRRAPARSPAAGRLHRRHQARAGVEQVGVSSPSRPTISLRSCPAEKAGPAPASTTHASGSPRRFSRPR